MHSLHPAFLDAIRLNSADGAALTSLGGFRGRQELFQRQTPEILGALREAAQVESAESSNRIEGIVAEHDRIEALVLKNSTPRDRSEQEIAGYRDALELLHTSAREMAFTTNVVLQLHAMLYRYAGGQGGRWKMAPNEIIERDPRTGAVRIRFSPPSPVATPGRMRDLTEGYALAMDQQREPLIVVPLAIFDFLRIHPFADGNGRTARLLTLLLLYHAGIAVGRYISLERIIEDSKETYDEALEHSSAGWHEGKHDPLPWLRYFWGVVTAAYKEFEERVGTLRVGRGAKTEMIEAAIARRVGTFAISDIEADCPGVTRDWIRMVFRRLKAEGEIELIGRGRGARWVKRP